jgi:hypothetical protein
VYAAFDAQDSVDYTSFGQASGEAVRLEEYDVGGYSR